jgi:hypothetical protein
VKKLINPHLSFAIKVGKKNLRTSDEYSQGMLPRKRDKEQAGEGRFLLFLLS